MPNPGLIVVLIMVLGAEFINGWTDAPNAIATVVSTRVLSPLKAVIMAAILNLAGVLLAGTAVAMTIGKGLIDTTNFDPATGTATGLTIVASAIMGILIFSTFAWYYGLPISKSHELMAGLAGAGCAVFGLKIFDNPKVIEGWGKVLKGLGYSTLLGFMGGLILMFIIYRLFARVHLSKVRGLFGRLQILSSAFMAFSHGTNDGQKFVGVFALALALGGIIPMHQFQSDSFDVIKSGYIWIVFICAITMGIGTLVGGWRIMKTMGYKVTKLEPVQGFAAETAAAAVITLASHNGIPLSTTHTISTAIMGVGSTRRLSAVRWGVTGHIVLAWLLTFPCTFIISFITATIIKWVS